jgi:5'-methylthioadenosine nucleosidase
MARIRNVHQSGVLVVVAMEAEAEPIRAALGLSGHGDVLSDAFPARLWTGDRVAVACNGNDPHFGVDSIGTQPAITTSLHAIQRIDPSIVISAGTAGGFTSRGGRIGAVYLADRVVFHDRRIAIPGWDAYGLGDYPVLDLATIACELGFETGTVTTGNALDAPPVDLERMSETHAVAKEMEAAAVAWVCQRMGVAFTALKVITDLVDEPEATSEQFYRNLAVATERLAVATPILIAAIRAAIDAEGGLDQ